MNLPALVDALRSSMPELRAQVPRSLRLGLACSFVLLCVATFGPALIGTTSLAHFVFQACGPFCHQEPERSFHVAGLALPLCTRCTGMWIGITVGIAIGVLTAPKRRWSAGTITALVALGLSEADHLREIAGNPGWPWVRFWLGMALFLGVTVAVSWDVLSLLVAGWNRITRRKWLTRHVA